MNINATALYQKINEHPAISARLSAISDQEELANEVVRLGEEFCLPVTLEEVSSYLVREQNAELSDDELEMVVGGKSGAKGDKDGNTIISYAPDDNNQATTITLEGVTMSNEEVLACVQKS